MTPHEQLAADYNHHVTRRWFFRECGVGLGTVALASLLNGNSRGESPAAHAGGSPLAPKKPHLPAKAKNVIFLFMAGAPSHLELFDYKPALAKMDGKLPPPELLKGYRAAFINPNSTFLCPEFKIPQQCKGRRGMFEMVPDFGKTVDHIAIVKSLHTDAFNHAP